MSLNDRRREPVKFPGSRYKHSSTARQGSFPWMVKLLTDARTFATRFNIDADKAWTKAGGIVEATADHTTKALKQALVTLLESPALNPTAPLDTESDQAVGLAVEALELTEL